MGRLLVSVSLLSFLGVLSPVLASKPVLKCSAYDEELVNGMCEIALEKIPQCPGIVQGDVCLTAAELN